MPAPRAEPRCAATLEFPLVACLRDSILAEPAVMPQLERERAHFARRWPIRVCELAQLLRGMKAAVAAETDATSSS